MLPKNDMGSSVYAQIIELLDKQQLPYKLHEHEAITTVQDVEEKLPFLVDKMLKTIAFKMRNGRYVLTGLRGHDRLDYRKLAQALGTNRRNVTSLSPTAVEAELGFEVGGVGPFALREDVWLFFDDSLPGQDVVYFGSGKNTITIEMTFEDLLRVSDGRVVPLAKIE